MGGPPGRLYKCVSVLLVVVSAGQLVCLMQAHVRGMLYVVLMGSSQVASTSRYSIG